MAITYETPNQVTVLAENHWEYVETTLRAHGAPEEDILIARHHYITAFVHGYKHAKANLDS